MSDRPPKQVGYTAEQRAAMQAVEEQSLLDLTSEMIRRLNREADRLEAFVSYQEHGANRGDSDGPAPRK